MKIKDVIEELEELSFLFKNSFNDEYRLEVDLCASIPKNPTVEDFAKALNTISSWYENHMKTIAELINKTSDNL